MPFHSLCVCVPSIDHRMHSIHTTPFRYRTNDCMANVCVCAFVLLLTFVHQNIAMHNRKWPVIIVRSCPACNIRIALRVHIYNTLTAHTYASVAACDSMCLRQRYAVASVIHAKQPSVLFWISTITSSASEYSTSGCCHHTSTQHTLKHTHTAHAYRAYSPPSIYVNYPSVRRVIKTTKE